MTVVDEDPWATLDALLNIEVVSTRSDVVGPVAFYGRCSTEDNQDPATSRGWQLNNAQRFVEHLGATIVEEFFDIGQSRSVSWERRPEANRLLTALKIPSRGWSAVVVGEGTRCWFGNQFSLFAPRVAAYDVDLWVPELGGRFDARNPSHTMLMSVLGGMSESERQHVQARVRAAMDNQVITEGRHQGGRAPYGYTVVNAGPHPNPAKAAVGQHLRVLAIDPAAATVVRRIFAEYLDDRSPQGDRAIAAGLNRDRVPCPSAHRPEQNQHRPGDGWQASTIRAILENPRYTGYAFFGRWTKHEALLDPDDVAAGFVVRFRRSAPGRIVRSRVPAHPAIIDVADFTLVQLRRRSRATGDGRGRGATERAGRTTQRRYLFRGRLRCALCGRKMPASPRGERTYYRCHLRTLAPDAPTHAYHPRTVNIREDDLRRVVDRWLTDLFAPANVEATIAQLVRVDEQTLAERTIADAQARLTQAQTRIRRFQDAIAAGVSPDAVTDAINEAQTQRATAHAQLAAVTCTPVLTAAQVRALIDDLGDVRATLADMAPLAVDRLYAAIGLQIRYDPVSQDAEMAIHLTTRTQAGRLLGPRAELIARRSVANCG